MTSWLGGSLSSLKGQISNLITEGTEELSDPKEDLNVAKLKIIDLESQIRSFISNTDELLEKNNELKIKLQSEEMMLQQVSESYKYKLKEKEDCIELLRSQISSVSGQLCNVEGGGTGGEQWRQTDYYDFVNESHVSKGTEVDSLKLRISELGQELLKFRSQGSVSGDNDNSMEESIMKALEAQRQDLELQHSNYVMELQQEHNKQLSFMKRCLQQRDGTSENEEYEPFERLSTDSFTEIHQEASFKHDCVSSGIQTEESFLCYKDNSCGTSSDHLHNIQDPLSLLIDSIRAKITNNELTVDLVLSKLQQCETASVSVDSGLHGQCDIVYQGSLDGQATDMSTIMSTGFFRPTMLQSQNVGDSLSQFSDISQVSVTTRLLDEHVRHLSTSIDEYEHQLTSIDDVSMSCEQEDDPEQLTDKLQLLKMKLSERKNLLIEQNDSEIRGEVSRETPVNIGDSWECSSVNSLVEECTVDSRPVENIESLIEDIYEAMYLHTADNDLSAKDILLLIKNKVEDTVKVVEDNIVTRRDLFDIYKQFVSSENMFEDVCDIINGIRIKLEEIREGKCFIDKHLDLEQLVLKYDHEKSELDVKIIELEERNKELEDQLGDMSSTISRYESLEKVCDSYEKELQELKRGGKKIDFGMDSEDILEHVKTFNEEKDECIEKLESRIISLQNFCEEKDDFIKAQKEHELELIYEYDCSIGVLNCEMDNLRSAVEKSYENEIEYKKEMYRMSAVMREKEDMINSLNEELTMLSHQDNDEDDVILVAKPEMLDISSQTEDSGVFGCKEDWIELLEKHDMLIVENGRLGEVIEAQADSLGQYEVRVNSLEAEIGKLSRSSESLLESETSQEMTRETLQHLSQMIRDRDWEVEALRAKNDSLCAIIKESSVTSDTEDTVGHIDKLLNEKEVLSKEVLWYQENREQLVNALNLKHKESLNYHGEIQRLVAFINSEQVKWNQVSLENENMKEEIRLLTENCSEIKETAVVGLGQLPSYEECAEPPYGGGGGVSEEKYVSLKERVANLEMENRMSSGEIRRLEKLLENVSFDLEESRLQLNDLTECHSRCQTQLEHYQEQLGHMCKSDMKSSELEDRTKDIWNASQEVATVELIESGQLDKDNIEAQFRLLQLHSEDCALQIEQLKCREIKLLKEKQILQEHLIRVEESYTQDATIAEDREQSLRLQLRQVEDSLTAAQDRVKDLENELSNLTNKFLLETRDIRLDRDETLERLCVTESQLKETLHSYSNLQTVLDKIQQEHSMELSFQKERLLQELSCVTKDLEKWKVQCQELQRSIETQNDIVEAAQRLTDQMERKDDQLAEIQAIMSRKEEVIDSLKMEIRKLNSFTESKVDKILMRNLVIGYFHTPLNKRQDALRVIGSLLQFSDKDYNQIGIDTANKSGWFSWLRAPASDGKDNDKHSQEHSFSELFIRFLERESAPLPQLRLPTNQVAAEARQRTSLSHSEEFPYVNMSSASQISDHHKFFTPSPVITKRNGVPSDSDSREHREPPLLLISNLQEVKSDGGGSSETQRPVSSHRRTDSKRNALLSLLEQ